MQEQAQEHNETPVPEDAIVAASILSGDDMRVLEAMLFASVEPLSTNAIRERMGGGDTKDIGGMLMQLKTAYEGRGVQLVELDGSWAFRTAADLGDALQMTKEVQRKLSRAAMETLAIVAYHQPVTRAEIENIRGVATNKGTLDVLMEMGWVKPGRRRESPGRPLTWVTTTAFMDHFGLESMSELPGLDELKASGLLDRRPAIDALPGTGDLFGEGLEQLERDAAMSEGDDEEPRDYEEDGDEDSETEFGGAGRRAEDEDDEFDSSAAHEQDDEDENDDDDEDEYEDGDDDGDDDDDEDDNSEDEDDE